MRSHDRMVDVDLLFVIANLTKASSIAFNLLKKHIKLGVHVKSAVTTPNLK